MFFIFYYNASTQKTYTYNYLTYNPADIYIIHTHILIRYIDINCSTNSH